MDNKLSQMSGEGNFSQAPRLSLNVLRFNGKKGRFSLIKLLSPKEKTDKGERHPEVDLGESVVVRFLKVRRKLIEKRSKKPEAGDPKLMSSNEHNSKDNAMLLYKDKGVEQGTSDELKAKYPSLRTVQVVYAIFGDEVVRVNFKGAALGSNAKAKDVHDFYSYISSFDKNPDATDKVKDHFYEFETKLTSIEETGELGEYYTVMFERGKKLDTTQMKEVGDLMEKVYDYTLQSDAFYNSKIALLRAGEKIIITEKEKAAGADGIVYPEEDIDPEDIPF